MSENIKLTINNRTNLDLIFSYDDVDYPVKRHDVHVTHVEAGDHISVRDPNRTKVTRNKFTVEPDYFVSVLDRNITINCELIGWQLRLSLGTNVV